MIFTPLALQGAVMIDVEPHRDERGFFARTWCAEEFREHGLDTRLAQCSVSYNHHRGTLRGMHYQIAPMGECKLVRCVRGSVYDVILDLRPESATFGQWASVELSAETRRMVFIPEGFAHGVQTLEDDTELFYQISVTYSLEHARGVRWNDPAFGIRWPIEHPILGARDAAYPDFVR